MSTGDPPSYWEAYFQHIMPKTYSTQTMTTTPAPTSGYVALICEHCEGNHFSERCPYIKAIEYDDAGKVRRIEFFPRPVKLPPPVVTVSWDSSIGKATWNPDVLRTLTAYGRG